MGYAQQELRVLTIFLLIFMHINGTTSQMTSPVHQLCHNFTTATASRDTLPTQAGHTQVTHYSLLKLTVENICSGPSSVSGLKSDFFCSLVSRYLIQPAIADNDLKTEHTSVRLKLFSETEQ